MRPAGGRVAVVDRDRSDLVAERVARMILKHAARVAGFSGSDLCLFGFPRDVREPDAISESSCEPDRSTLVQGGLARP